MQTFTLEVAGKPTVVFREEDMQAAEDFISHVRHTPAAFWEGTPAYADMEIRSDAADLADMLTDEEWDGRWDGKAPLTVRAATQEEHEAWRSIPLDIAAGPGQDERTRYWWIEGMNP